MRNEERGCGTRNEDPELGTRIRNEERGSGTRNEDPEQGPAMCAQEPTVMVGNGLYLPGRIEGNRVSFLVDTGSGVSILAARTRRNRGPAEDELTRYWGRLCSVEG